MNLLILILAVFCGRADHLQYDQCVSYGTKCVKQRYSEKQIIEDRDVFAMLTYQECTEELQ